jgi:hypothetical protein
MQLAEEGLPQRLVIGARLALFGPPEGRILAGSGGPLLCWNQARKENQNEQNTQPSHQSILPHVAVILRL